MRARRDAALRLLKTMMVATVVIPIAIFCYASWVAYRNAYREADARLWASLGIMAEHTSRIFQSVDLTFTAVDAIAGDLSDAQIRAAEPALHAQLSKLEMATAAVDAILITDKDGHVLVSSEISPIPNSTSIADRDYFLAQKNHDVGTFIGKVLAPHGRKAGGEYFGVSRRRPSQNGEFSGVVFVAIESKVFTDFYTQLAHDAGGGSFTLARADGMILARYPPAPDSISRLGPDSGFMRNMTKYPEGAIVSTEHSLEGVARRMAFRPLDFGNLYVSDGVGTDTIIDDWLLTVTAHLYFGIPAVIVLLVLVLMTMRRTREFYAEVERRELAEQALRQAQKMEAVGQLTGGVAHDFNNLLTIIIGNLGIAKRGVVEARAQRALDNALTGATRATQLTQRLLAFSRQQPLNPRTLDANKLIMSMSDLLNRSLGENISLETISGAGLWTVEADPAELEATLLNLALNARDAMPNGGKLTVETSNAYLDDDYCRPYDGIHPGQYVLIAVSDNGAGMPAETIERAFDPFFTTKEAGKGTGLGLSQVYGFVKQSGGHVKIYSEVGEGTTVKLYLPRSHGEEPPPPPEEPAGSDRGRGEIILVVEDDDGVRQYAAEILRDLGYQVIEAKDSAAALRLLEADKPFDLLLTDVVLPGKNGRELANEVKRRRPAVKIVFMTGYSRNAIVHQGRLDAGTALITKPLLEGVMARKIRQVLDAPARAS